MMLRDKFGRFIKGQKLSFSDLEKLLKRGIDSRFKKGHKVPQEWRDTVRNMRLGRKHTEITKDKMKKSWRFLKKRFVRMIPSRLETKTINIIKKLKLPYKFVGNGKFFIERKNPDFININGEKIAIEVFYRGYKTAKYFLW